MFPQRNPSAPRFHLTELQAAGASTNHLDLTASIPIAPCRPCKTYGRPSRPPCTVVTVKKAAELMKLPMLVVRELKRVGPLRSPTATITT